MPTRHPNEGAASWPTLKSLTVFEVDTLLDTGRVVAEMRNGRWWDIRRNGASKTWKTRPGEFRIPVKAGMKSCAYVEHDNRQHFRVRPKP